MEDLGNTLLTMPSAVRAKARMEVSQHFQHFLQGKKTERARASSS
jgi:hypothetical protein